MRVALMAMMLAITGPAWAADRPVIRSESDLPPVRFPFATPPSDVMGRPAFIAMLPAIRTESERLLRDYDIQDSSIQSQLRLGLAAIAVLDGRGADADRLVAAYRAGEAKPQRRQIGGLLVDLAAAIRAAPRAQQCRSASARLTTRLASADPVAVRDQFLGSFSEIQTASPAYYAGNAVGVIDPVASQRGSIDVLKALLLARWRAAATTLPDCRAALTTVARAWLDAPANRPVDVWPERQPAAALFAAAKPVTVAVWDSGYDVTLFPGQLARDPADALDGADNDGNGVVDDWNGPTYDAGLLPRAGVMTPPTRFLQSRLAAQMAYDKGEQDLNFGLDTPEAALFAEFGRTAAVRDQGDELLASIENHNRVHGTACASEIADDAPYVRLYNVSALPWGRGEDRLDIPYDEQVIARWAAAIAAIGKRMRGADVRIVNMSWGLTIDEIAQQLLDRGLEADPVRARARGIAMQKTIADALRTMIAASRDILFVVAAGNSNQSDEIQADAVQGIALPNILIVGATGTNGRPTGFTVFGKGVALYAQGEAVKLRWPGNIATHASGTSMAAPLVARAAAQMLAIQPRLTPSQLRDGLTQTATPGDNGLKLLHPAAAVAWAQRR